MSIAVSSITSGASATAAATAKTAATGSEVEDRFLKLLVTQLKNQDPLNPLDNAQVTSQLAQLNTANGISQLNQTMAAFAATQASAQAVQAAQLIGRGVMTEGSTLQLKDGDALFGVQLAQAAEHLQVVISDAAGKVVQTVDAGPQPAGTILLHWDGATDAGGTAAAGTYKFALKALSAGGAALDSTALAVDTVKAVTAQSGGAILNLSGGAGVSLSAVRQIL
jgi:flagellar basal-body rod modification protein FlgD